MMKASMGFLNLELEFGTFGTEGLTGALKAQCLEDEDWEFEAERAAGQTAP